MKKLILLAFVATCVSCAEQKKESETAAPAKVTIKCDSADMKTVDPKTGAETITRIWRCDSIVEEAAK
jgi:hypothetical protein